MDSIPCNLVLLPDQQLAEKAINLSRILAQFDSYFVLEEGKCFPHVSMYKFQLNASDIPEVGRTLAAISQSIFPFQLRAEKYSFEHDGYHFVDVQYEKTAELLELQGTVIEALNPIRADMRAKDRERMQSATGLALEYFQKYGYNLIGELYRPHISLSRLKADNLDVPEVLPNLHYFDGNFVRLGLFEIGDHGTAVRRLAESQPFGAQKTANSSTDR